MRRRCAPALAVVVVALALAGAACGGGDDDSVSTGTTSTTAAGNDDFGGDGNDVLAVQRALNALSCNAGPLDGELGPDTLAGIRRFQTAAGLTVDGIVGPQTRAAIEHAVSSGSPNCTALPPTPSTPSTTPTTSGGSGTPPCTDPAIRGALTASLLPGEQLVKLNPFRCAITWAVATPTITSPSDPSGTNVTYLLRWSGTAWQPVDRGTYCDSGQVPAAIYPQACQSA